MSEFRRNILSQQSEVIDSSLIFYAPLTENGTDIIGNRNYALRNGITFSENGAEFVAGTYDLLSYNLNAYDYGSENLKSVMFEFYIKSGSSYSGYMYILHMLARGKYEQHDTHIPTVPCPTFFSYINRNLGVSNVSDQYTNYILQYDKWYKLLVVRNGSYDNIYLNGGFVSSKVWTIPGGVSDYHLGYMTIGNNWRGLYKDNTRAFNGFIKNVKLYNKTFTNEEAIKITTI